MSRCLFYLAVAVAMGSFLCANLRAQSGISSSQENQLFNCNPGPWGDLEYHFTYLEAPQSVMDFINTPSQRTIWYFPGWGKPEVQTFLAGAGLPLEDQEKVLDSVPPNEFGKIIRFFPPTDLLENLAPEIRETIYSELRKWPENTFHYNPTIIESGNVAAWFSHSNVSLQTIERISKLTYKIGASTAFSDVPLLLSQISNDKEERAVMKALTRTRGLILRLKVNPSSDLSALKQYWGAGFENREIPPIFESLAAAEQGNQIDVMHVFPPTPRKLLNTYPSIALGAEGQFPGSFWTALNFFNYSLNESFNDRENALEHFHNGYEIATPPHKFGDLVIISDSTTHVEKHAAVFIADDIVFTKNGRALRYPFLLMKVNDLLARYATGSPPKIEYWRKKVE